MSEIFRNVNDVLEFMDTIPKFGAVGQKSANFDLSRMEKFCRYMGNPQNDFTSIHVAGTNGKGTVCRMLASVYMESGFNVGLYTSPHLIDFRERFLVNAAYIEDEALVDYFNLYGAFIQQSKFTYFEITTALAFWYFSKKRVDIAILETGLGGRLDATNVVHPVMSVITSIGLDHMDILGDTIEKIALEKAGIIKRETPVVVGVLEPKSKYVIEKIAKDRGAEWFESENLKPVYSEGKIILENTNPEIKVDGSNWKKIDAQNVSMVYIAVNHLRQRFQVLDHDFEAGIEHVGMRFPRRAVFEKLLPGYKWYFDGAHNSQSIQHLISHLLEKAPANRWNVVLSFMKDKLTPEVAELWSQFDHIYLYEMKAQRAANLADMRSCFPGATVLKNPKQILHHQLKTELVIFSGSFYFYSIVSNWMGSIASADQLNPSAL